MDQLDHRTTEEPTIPAVVYALYILGVVNGVTILIGLIMAYVKQGDAGPVMRSHYTFLIRTFWLSIGWFILGAALVVVGIPFSLILIGIPMMLLGGLIMAAVGIWFVVRSVLGVVHLARREPYPRPYALLM